MNADAPTVEPELRNPPPRVLRARWGGRFLKWFFFLMTFVVPLGLAVAGYFAQQKLNALTDHGARTTGHIATKWTRTSKSTTYYEVAFDYVVDGRPYSLQESRPLEIWNGLVIRSEAPIVYLPEAPATAMTAYYFDRQGGTSLSAIGLYVVAGIFLIIFGGIWWYTARVQNRLHHLGTDGIAVRGKVLNVQRYGAAKNDQWQVDYEFLMNRETRVSKTYVNGKAAKELSPGGTVTVLYDPLDPECFDLYPAVTRVYAVETV